MAQAISPSARFILLLALVSSSTGLQAALRCGTKLVELGDTRSSVISHCGEPAGKEVITPELGANGRPPEGSVTVEYWRYGPNNGAYRYLKFIDGRLTQIELRRN